MAIEHPIHTGTVNGHRVRFFRSPSTRPDFPWCVQNDLIIAAGGDGDMQQRFVMHMRQGPFRDQSHVYASPDGPVVACSHSCAQGLIGAFEQWKMVGERFDVEYTAAASEALKEITKHMGDAGGIAYAINAVRIGKGLEPISTEDARKMMVFRPADEGEDA